jgi:nucleotide-binding universal stress UspA family protein
VVETKLPWDDAAPMLREATRELDLLVLGSRASSGLRRVVQGSVSTDVLHGAHCPVVVVPAGVHPTLSAPATT